MQTKDQVRRHNLKKILPSATFQICRERWQRKAKVLAFVSRKRGHHMDIK